MSKTASVKLSIEVLNKASAGVKQVARDYLDVQKQINRSLSEEERAVAGVMAARRLGIKTENDVKTAIKQTQHEYDVLRKSGVATGNDIARAHEAMLRKVRSLNAELRTQNGLLQKGAAIGKGLAAAGAGVAAAGYVVKQPLETARTYNQQMTYATMTATAGKGLTPAQRLAQIGLSESLVKEAVRTGGGLREDAATAFNALIGSGQYDVNNVKGALNASTKTAFAMGASAEDAAQLTLSLKQFGVNDLQLGHDIAARGGQLGSFEYKDLAGFLNEQAAMAKTSGYSGVEGFKKLVMYNQLAKTTAGTSNAAGNNITNLLQKMSTQEFSDALADNINVKGGDPTRLKGKKKPTEVFDWNTYKGQQREQGTFAVEAFVKLLERELQGNAKYTQLQKELSQTSNGDQRKALLDDMSNLAVGSKLGGIIADRQALMGALAIVYNKDKAAELQKGLDSASGTVEADSAAVKQTEWAQAQALEQEKLFANAALYDKVNGALGKVEGSITGWAQKHEGLATTAYGASLALIALAGAAGTAALVKGGLGSIGGTAGKVAGETAEGAILKGGGMAAGAKKLGMVGIAGAVGYGVGSIARYGYMKTELGQKFDAGVGSIGANVMAMLGKQEAKDALAAEAKYDQMIQQQEQMKQQNARALQLQSQTIGVLQQIAAKDQQISIDGKQLFNVYGDRAENELKRGSTGRGIPYANP